MNQGQKALKACADYARLNVEIRQLTQFIAETLFECPGVNGAMNELGGTDVTHLKDAYTPDVENDPVDHWNVYMSDIEIREFLTVCPHCLAAHQAIQDRKAARRSLGATKRVFTMLGKKVPK
jgi:hypothetical protein